MPTPVAQSVDAVGIDSPYRWVMLGGVWLIYYCFGMVISSVAPLVNVIVADLKLSLSGMGGILGAWQLVYLFAAIPLGIAIDRIGLRLCLTLAAIIIALSAIARGFAYDDFTLWLAVAFFGLGGPLISIGAPKVIASWFGSKERGLAMGIYMTGPALGGITSLSLTNSLLMPLVDNQWQLVFFIFGAVAAGCALLWLLINIPASSRLASQNEDNRQRQNTFRVFKQLLQLPLVRLILLMSIGIFILNHGISNWLPAILRATGMSATQAGYWAAIPTIVGVFGSLTIPALAKPQRRFFILISLFCALLLAIILLINTTGPWLVIGLMIQGVARSSMMTIAILILMETPEVGAKNIGIAGGLFFTAAEIGGVLGPLGIGVMADHYAGFNPALWGLCLLCLILIGMSFWLRRLLH